MTTTRFQLIKYNHSLKNDWDTLIQQSPNSTLLHFRDFMEYHQDRFEDASYVLMKNDVLVAAFPASKQRDVFTSHAGLTYGGIIVLGNLPSVDIIHFFELLLEALLKEGFKSLIYKQMPYIYHKDCASIDEYVLHKLGFQKLACSLSSFCMLNKHRAYTIEKQRSINKALKNGVVIQKSSDWSDFWDILKENLQSRYEATSTHSLSEIKYLKDKFPEEIQLYGAYLDGVLLAGTVLFISSNVVHLQYIASSPFGRSLNVNDLLVHTILNSVSGNQTFFDYGISTENNGRYLNTGLLHHKEGFDLSPITYNTFTLNL